MLASQTENINNSYFDGFYKEIWRSLIPEALTKAETEYLVQEAKLDSDSKVLDLMCGYGRNAIALAQKSINVTAVDNLADYIEEINSKVKKENLPLHSIQADVLDYEPEGLFDLIICMGNSVCFFNEEDSRKLFSKISSHLRPGGKFIFNTWMIAEIVIKQFQEKSWIYVGELKFLTESRYLFKPTRIEFESTIITPAGETEIKKGVDYIYSLSETVTLLNYAGLAVKEIYSIPGKKKFSLGEYRAYFIAEKI